MITLEIINNKDLTQFKKDLINKSRINELGKNEKKDFNKDYEPDKRQIYLKSFKN